MSSGKHHCSSCQFDFLPAEAVEIPEGKGCPRCKAKVTLQELPEVLPPEKAVRLLSSGTIFDKYRIISFVGSGGMAEVYKAEHLLLKRTFALKVMKELNAKNESTAAKRFLREAKCFHLLDHPNIVRVFDIGCDKTMGLLYISMELLEGSSLAAEPGKRFPETELLKIASDIAKALEALEKNAMVHRDIKPSNIMRDTKGNCKLMDLGIAKNRWESSDGQTLTIDNCVIGTPAYASPEQCRSPHNVDIRSDIYSLGITLYQLASGVLPYAGTTPLETILNVIHKAPLPLEKLPTSLSKRTIKLIECMIAKSPEDRPPDAASLRYMIETVQKGGDPVFPRSRLRRKKFFAAAGAFLLLAAVSAGFIWQMRSEDKKESLYLTQEKIEKTAAPLPFSRQQFVDPAKPRTLENRIAEYEKILKFLDSDSGSRVPLRKERQRLFADWKGELENLLKRKKERRSRRISLSLAPAFRAEIETFLKTSQLHAFHNSPEGVALTNRIMAALQGEEMDPDTVFEEKNKVKRSLTGLALYGKLPLQEQLLKMLIFSGADIDAGHGPEEKLPITARTEQIRGRLSGVMAFNGADNVDSRDGSSLLLKVLDPYYPYMVCLPTGNHVDWALADFLVKSGALLDVENKEGRTPLHLAALHNRGELLNSMLLAGAAGGNTRDQQGDTPFQLAVRNHASEAVKVLTRFGLTTPVTLADRAQGSLISAIMTNTPLQAEQALEAGASLEYLYANKLNALQNAVIYRRNDLVKYLIKRGASPLSNGKILSLPGMAVCTNSPEIFKLLVKKFAPENMVLNQTHTPVWLPETVLTHYRKRADIAEKFFDAMIECAWDINAPGPGGYTVLERALLLQGIHADVIRTLLEKGADPVKLQERKKADLKNLPPDIRQLLQRAISKKKH